MAAFTSADSELALVFVPVPAASERMVGELAVVCTADILMSESEAEEGVNTWWSGGPDPGLAASSESRNREIILRKTNQIQSHRDFL